MVLKLLRIGTTLSRAKFFGNIQRSQVLCLTSAVQEVILKTNFPAGVGNSGAKCISTSNCFSQLELRNSGRDVTPRTKTEKAKQAAKDTSYGLVILVGVTGMGAIFYVLYKELLSKAGPTQVFGDALEKCRDNQELYVALGTPIEGYGETNSRGRRRHVSHLAYIDNQGREAMRMKFYIKGSSGRTGTVQVDSVIVGRKISYRYIIAYLDVYPRRIIVVLDERSGLDKDAIEEFN